MTQLATPSEIEEKARRSGKTIAQVCRDADVSRSTFTRWKLGRTSPSIDVYDRLLRAAEADGAAA